MENTEETYLSIEEAADILRLNSKAVNRLVESGDIGGIEVGREWRVARRELAAFVGRSFGRGASSCRRRQAS